MTPVNVFMSEKSLTTRRFTSECDVLPILYKIVRLREFPAALILPFNRIFSPFILTSSNTCIK